MQIVIIFIITNLLIIILINGYVCKMSYNSKKCPLCHIHVACFVQKTQLYSVYSDIKQRKEENSHI